MKKSSKVKQSNRKIVSILISLVLLMLCLTYASVPLYSIFCKVTGFGGTVKREFRSYSEEEIGFRLMKVRFNADVSPGLPLIFSSPTQGVVSVKPGENKLVFYSAENFSDEPIDVIAIYNVTPHKAGKYFYKVACFCFNRQTLQPHEKVVMPVSFFIDPEIENDHEMSEVHTMTLSYTFFKYSS